MNAILVFVLRLIFVLLSYLFIGWIGYTIFTDLRSKQANTKVKTIPPIILRTEIGEEQVEKQFAIPEIIIGRDPACDFPLDDETISLRHSKISFHHKQWWVEDLGSTNGTYVNEAMIEEPLVLTSSDQLRLGRKTLNIKINFVVNGESNE